MENTKIDFDGKFILTVTKEIQTTKHWKFYDYKSTDKKYNGTLMAYNRDKPSGEFYKISEILEELKIFTFYLKKLIEKKNHSPPIIMIEKVTTIDQSKYKDYLQEPTDSFIVTFIRDLAVCLYHLRNKNIIHFGISLSNIYVKDDKFVLGGFENYRRKNELDDFLSIVNNLVDSDKRPPEFFYGTVQNNIGCEIDMWLLGTILFKFLTKREFSNSQFFNSQTAKIVNLDGFNLKAHWKVILQGMLNPSPKLRIQPVELLVFIDDEYVPKPLRIYPIKYINSGIKGGDTKSWIKNHLCKNDDKSVPDNIFINKLIYKGINEPQEKIKKVFNSLMRLDNQYCTVQLKSLYVIYVYISYVHEIGNIVLYLEPCLQKFEEIWCDENQNYYRINTNTPDLVDAIKCFIEIIRIKVQILKQFPEVHGNWSNLCVNEETKREAIIRFLILLQACTKSLNYQSNKSLLSKIHLFVLSEELLLNDILNNRQADRSQNNSRQFYTSNLNSSSEMKVFKRVNTYNNGLLVDTMKCNLQEIEDNDEEIIEEQEGSKVNFDVQFLNQSSLLIEKSQVEILTKISKGSRTKTYRGTYKSETVAVKVYTVTGVVNSQRFKTEVELLNLIKHENIIEFIGAYGHKKLFIFTKYCEGGKLSNILRGRYQIDLSTNQKFIIAIQIARAIENIHSNGCIHGNLKSSCVLFEKSFETDFDEIHVRVANFGFSGISDDEFRINLDDLILGKKSKRWVSPEMMMFGDYGNSTDVYSFGVILWEIFTQVLPFEGYDDGEIIYRVASLKEKPKMNCGVLQKFSMVKELISDCLNYDKNMRPGISLIINVLTALHGYYLGLEEKGL